MTSSDDSTPGTGARTPGEPAASTTLQKTPAASAATPSTAVSDFGRDAGVTTLSEAFRDYVQRVKGGQVGALPAVLGLVVLTLIFSQVSDLFLSAGNIANLAVQASATSLIAMGLVFVLLLGEIDLAAGTAAGVSAAMMALAVNNEGNVRETMGPVMYIAVVIFMAFAFLIAARSKLWIAAVLVAIALVLVLTNAGGSAPVALLLGIATGVSIGCVTGFLVSRVGIPSFVVTLALFLAWQGVILRFIGEGASLPTRQVGLLNALANRLVPPAVGWLLLALALGIYGLVTITRSISRRREGLAAEPMAVVLSRLGILTVIGVGMLLVLNKERGPNPEFSIAGVPYVVPIIIGLMVFWTLILAKTTYGRHVYAVGGNAEAARRAGIDVKRIRLSVFIISGGMAAIGGIVLSSFVGGVQSDLGGGNTLLFAVGAAVIGGTSLFGGRGRVRDAVLGGFVIAMIPNGLGLIPNMSAAAVYIITALVLLVAASVDALSRKRAGATGNL